MPKPKMKPVEIEETEVTVQITVKLLKDKTASPEATKFWVENYLLDCLNEPGVAVETESAARKSLNDGDSAYSVIGVN